MTPVGEKICEDFRCLNTVVFVLFLESGGRFLSVAERLGFEVLCRFFKVALNLNIFRSLRHVLRIPTERLSHCILLSEAGID